MDLQKSMSTLVKGQPLVAVFFGSTSTIGQAALRALASAAGDQGKGYRAYLVGRNAKATEPIIAECRSRCPAGQFTFVQIKDLSLIRDVDAVCEEILRLEGENSNARIDYLMLSQGGAIFKPRQGKCAVDGIYGIDSLMRLTDTKEGIDITMSLMYYSRMRAITKLLPLLLKSSLPATVVSVYAAGIEQKLYPDDLSLRNPARYNYSQARSHMVYMHTLFFEALAEKHPDKLRLIHIFPGVVVGPGFWNPEVPFWMRALLRYVLLPLFGRWITTPPEQCGQRMLTLISPSYPRRSLDQPESSTEVVLGTDGTPGSGVYSLGQDGKNNLNAKAYQKFDKDEMRQKIWDHTNRAFEVIESGGVFTE